VICVNNNYADADGGGRSDRVGGSDFPGSRCPPVPGANSRASPSPNFELRRTFVKESESSALLRYIFHIPVPSMRISTPSLSHLTPWLLKCVFETFEFLLYHRTTLAFQVPCD